jgi:beta-phosphoglucomutase-like phosphatase (HAD superfamily)
LLFDLDGTLVDSGEPNFLAYSDALAEVGVSIDRPRFEEVAFGRNWRQFLPAILADAGCDADPAQVAARKRALYPGRLSAIGTNAGLLTLLVTARPAFRTALVTTASSESVAAILAQLGIASLFDIVVTGDDVTRHKPEPDAYLLAAKRLGLSPGQCLTFEDSDIGERSARAAGVAVVRVAMS